MQGTGVYISICPFFITQWEKQSSCRPQWEIGQILDCANLGWYDKDKVEKLTNEKAILKDILKKALGEYDLCLLCESKGQYLHKCECMEDEECLQHMIKLWSNKK